MGEFEEETYSTVFKVLRHPVRRKIIRILSQGTQSFTDLQSAFKVNGAVLTYHLDAMKDLISKTEDGKYSLSTMGEGAMALMERVEDPPKITHANHPHPQKNSRRLTVLQVAAIGIAIVLLVSGTYLASISVVQEFYDVPYEWGLTDHFSDLPANWTSTSDWIPVLPDSGYWHLYTVDPLLVQPYGLCDVDGNLYDIRHIIHILPPSQFLNQLTDDYEANIYVNLKTNETAPSGAYNVTLNYLEHSTADNIYQQKHIDRSGKIQPVENSSSLMFSTNIFLPYLYPGEPRDKIPLDITINIWTNTTYSRTSEPAPRIADYLSVKATATEEFHSETQPYEIQGNIITITGIILVAAALAMHIPPLLRKPNEPTVPTQPLEPQK